MGQFTNYYEYVKGEAVSFYEEHVDEFDTDIDNGDTDVHDFINDYRLHEWADNDFIYVDLLDSAEILDQSDNVETDSGLWEGQEPEEAIKTKAFFTYRNDLYYAINNLFEDRLHNRASHFEEVITNLESQIDELDEDDDEDEIDELTEELEDAQQTLEYIEDAIERL